MVSVSSEKKYVYPAGLLKRGIAFFIDFFLLNIFVLGPFSGIFERLLGLNGGVMVDYQMLASNPELQSAISISMVAIGGLFLFYFVMFQIRFGQTIGMMLMKIFVIKVPPLNLSVPPKKKAKKSKEDIALEVIKEARRLRLSFFDAVIRNIFVIPVFPFALLWIVEPIYLIFSKDKMRLLEVLSKTKVVEMAEYDNSDSISAMQRWI